MATTRPIRDNAPWMTGAGKSSGLFDSDGNVRVSSGNPVAEVERPPTPPELHRFRREHLAPLGQSLTRNSMEHPPPDLRFGLVLRKGDSAASCLQRPTALGMAAVANDAAERHYKSRKAEPLGRSAQSMTVLPQHAKAPSFSFGVATKHGESARSVVSGFGATMRAEDVAAEEARHPVGAAKPRNYNWAAAGIDPEKKRFGIPSGHGDGLVAPMKDVVLGNPTKVQTRLLPRAVAEMRATSGEQLGQPKALNLNDPAIVTQPDFAFGKVQKRDEYGMKSLLQVGGVPNGHDESIGRSYTKSATLRKLRAEDNARVAAGEVSSATQSVHAEGRTFGCPTIRYDLQRPKFRKVTNTNNYGDDANAAALLYPTSFTANGLTDDSFTRVLTVDDIRDLNARCDLDLSDTQIAEAFAHARDRSPDGNVTLAVFRVALEELGF